MNVRRAFCKTRFRLTGFGEAEPPASRSGWRSCGSFVFALEMFGSSLYHSHLLSARVQLVVLFWLSVIANVCRRL